jgi:hypothetical protein
MADVSITDIARTAPAIFVGIFITRPFGYGIVGLSCPPIVHRVLQIVRLQFIDHRLHPVGQKPCIGSKTMGCLQRARVCVSGRRQADQTLRHKPFDGEIF